MVFFLDLDLHLQAVDLSHGKKSLRNCSLRMGVDTDFLYPFFFEES